jgi:hypothetical protein
MVVPPGSWVIEMDGEAVVVARVVIVVAVAFAVAGAASASAATALMPDLGMAKLSTVTVDTTTIPGHRLLRYTAVTVNIGKGRLEVRGSRPDTSNQMTMKTADLQHGRRPHRQRDLDRDAVRG